MNDGDYQTVWPAIRSFVAQARQFRDDPSALLDMQVELTRELLGAQEAKRRLEGTPASSEASNPAIQHAILVARRVVHVLREVADGIAWRMLNYDRLALSQLCRKQHTGAVERGTIANELEVAERHVAQGELTLLNDLTNFVRFGDVTIINDAGLKLIEVSTGDKAAKGRRKSRQQRKMIALRDFVNDRQQNTEGGRERLVLVRAEPRAHMETISQLIADSRRSGQSHARLSDSVAVDVFYQDPTTGHASEPEMAQLHNPFSQSGLALTAHSLDAFHRFERSRAPYSVFPLTDDDCADLLTGRAWIITYVNWGNLIRHLRRRKLTVRDLSRNEALRFSRLDVREKRVRRFGFEVSPERSNETSQVSFAEIARLVYEFLHEDSFVDSVCELVESHIPDEETWFTAFESEHLLWN